METGNQLFGMIGGSGSNSPTAWQIWSVLSGIGLLVGFDQVIILPPNPQGQ
jgi:hypothetical protein